MTAAIIVAAGAGRRLGVVAKAMLTTPDGSTFLERIARLCRTVGVTRHCVVVAEPHRAVTEAEAARLGLQTVFNPTPDRGMSSSVAAGFRIALQQFDDDAALLWPVDHARVDQATIELLLEQSGAGSIVIPTLQGRGGHPSLFGRALWPELAECDEASEGARTVVRRDPNRVRRLPVTDAGVRADVDTPSDLKELAQ